MSAARIAALRAALTATPGSHELRRLLAETLAASGDATAACDEYERLIDADVVPTDELLRIGEIAAAAGHAALLRRCLERARASGVVEGVTVLQRQFDDLAVSRGALRLVRSDDRQAGAVRAVRSEPPRTFADVGGLQTVKKTIHRMIVLPLQRPDLYAAYGRRTGGGVLLYGPPGVGKTMLAQATAGECGLPFFALRIEDVLDPYFGVSERRLHDAFEEARARKPCVLLIDELDAIGFARRKQQATAGHSLVDQLLQELDATPSGRMLVLGATNAPWDVDDALKRPGRFDRQIFVPPPDAEARAHILRIHLRGCPAEAVDPVDVARRTPLFSGADLRALVEQAIDLAMDEALATGERQPVTAAHLECVLKGGARPTTLEWLSTARAYVEFATQHDLYRDLADFLQTNEARSWRL